MEMESFLASVISEYVDERLFWMLRKNLYNWGFAHFQNYFNVNIINCIFNINFIDLFHLLQLSTKLHNS